MAKRPNYPALTGARAIAAGLVFLHHFTPDTSWVGSWLHDALTEGHIGVALFFVLSGFLICHNYSDDFERPSARMWFEYLRNRFARVYPLYFALLIPTMIFDISIGYQITPFIWLVNLTMTKAFFDDLKFSPGIGPSWSLTVEESFYWTAPFMFGLLKRSFIIPVLICYAVGTVLWAIGQQVQWYGFFDNIEFIRFYTYPGRAFEFWVGGGAAIYLLRKGAQAKGRGLTYVGIAGIFLTMHGLNLLKPYHGSLGNFGVHSGFGSILNNIILPVFVVFFYLGLVRERTWVQALLSTKLFLLLGRASYAFYLLQQCDWVARLEDDWGIASTTGRFLFTLALALAAYWIIEEPLQQFFRHFQWKGGSRKPPLPPAGKVAKPA